MENVMKKIDMQGIPYIEPLSDSTEWYWGMDYTSGDLYEAEELFQQGHTVRSNKLLFVHYPDGKVVQPVLAEKWQYLGRPVYYQNKIVLLLVDFSAKKIEIIQYDSALEQTSVLTELPLSVVPDCYNLMLTKSPLMLTRQGRENRFQIVWPVITAFDIENTECFCYRDGENLYFSVWYEDPEYREEMIVRRLDTGEIVDRRPGSLTTMPDGQMWLLT